MVAAQPAPAAAHLQCLRCGARHPLDPGASCCPACGAGADPGILDVVYDHGLIQGYLAGRQGFPPGPDLFRFLPLLPVSRRGPDLGAGGTPLVPAPRLARRLGLAALYLKDETRNPTRCLKDRATAVGVALALASGARDLYCASAGNAAISLAGFCAHAGLAAHVFVPREASAQRLAWLRRLGADVRVSAGGYDEAFAEAEGAAATETGRWFSRQCAYNPYLVEGKKTAALEIGEQLGGRAPDYVAAPVGDGCTLGALGKGFRELRTLGLLDRLPRLLGVQAEAMQPLVRRFRGEPEAEEPGGTAAASIAVRRPRNARRLLAELAASEGEMVAVPDAAIARAQRALAEEAGLVAELTAAAGLAGLEALGAERLEGRSAVVVVTGGRVD